MLLSGTALMPRAIIKNPLKYTTSLLKAVGCEQTSTLVIMKCLRSTSLEILMDANVFTESYRKPFGPIVDGKYRITAVSPNLIPHWISSQVPLKTRGVLWMCSQFQCSVWTLNHSWARFILNLYSNLGKLHLAPNFQQRFLWFFHLLLIRDAHNAFLRNWSCWLSADHKHDFDFKQL